MENGLLDLSRGMTGCLEGTYLSDADQLKVKEGKHFNTYKGESGTYLGLHTPLEMPLANGASLYAVTLVSKDTCDSVFFANRLLWSALSLVAMIGLLVLAVYLSRKFVRPISESINALMLSQPWERTSSGFPEIDALMEYVQEKTQVIESHEQLPPNVEELFHAFSERASTLTPTEHTIFRYFVEGMTLEEISSTAYISINTVKKHNTNINRKLGVSSRDELMLYIDLFRRTDRLDEITY
jgi:DNA-binding CsgD family transcriptional regulator